MRPAEQEQAELMKISINAAHSRGGSKKGPLSPACLPAYWPPSPPPSHRMVQSQHKLEQHVKTMCSWSSHWKAKVHLTWRSVSPTKDRTLGKPLWKGRAITRDKKQEKNLWGPEGYWTALKPHPDQISQQATTIALAVETSSHWGTPTDRQWCYPHVLQIPPEFLSETVEEITCFFRHCHEIPMSDCLKKNTPA